MKKLFFTWLFILTALCVQAQYHGGNNDGFQSVTVALQNLTPDIFHGGDNDGFQCVTVILQNPSPDIFHGGGDDGFQSVTIALQNPSPDIFHGGDNDGFHSVAVWNQNPTASIYTGGDNDGFNSVAVLNQNPTASIYTGGDNDGFNGLVVLNQNVSPSIYKGGGDDGMSSFLALSLQNPGALAVKLLSFDGRWSNQDALLDWVTEEEKDVQYYELERSIDGGITFETIAQVMPKGHFHNSYQYTDIDAGNLSATVWLYQLKSVALDGTATYSGIVRLTKDHSGLAIVLYPNPNQGQFVISIRGADQYDQYSYRLISMNGSLISAGTAKGTDTYIDVRGVAAGTYIMQLSQSGVSLQTFHIIINP